MVDAVNDTAFNYNGIIVFSDSTKAKIKSGEIIDHDYFSALLRGINFVGNKY